MGENIKMNLCSYATLLKEVELQRQRPILKRKALIDDIWSSIRLYVDEIIWYQIENDVKAFINEQFKYKYCETDEEYDTNSCIIPFTKEYLHDLAQRVLEDTGYSKETLENNNINIINEFAELICSDLNRGEDIAKFKVHSCVRKYMTFEDEEKDGIDIGYKDMYNIILTYVQ
jgi:hypothetical protein